MYVARLRNLLNKRNDILAKLPYILYVIEVNNNFIIYFVVPFSYNGPIYHDHTKGAISVDGS